MTISPDAQTVADVREARKLPNVTDLPPCTAERVHDQPLSVVGPVRHATQSHTFV